MQPIVEGVAVLESEVADVPVIEISSGEGAVIVMVRINQEQDAEDRISVIWNPRINRYTVDIHSIDHDGASSGSVDYVITPGEVIARLTEAIAAKASTWRRWNERNGAAELL